MRKLIAALLLSLGLASAALAQTTTGPISQIACNATAQAAIATATTTSLVNGVAGKVINICGWHVTSTQSASSTFQLQYGTQGGPCSTPVNVTPAFNVTSTAPSADHIEYASSTVPAGAQLCVASTGSTVGLAVLVYYSQY